MTENETRFYLREIHAYWTAPHISSEKLHELQRSELVETSTDEIPTVRLTREGQRVKAAARPQTRDSRVQSVATPKPRRAWRQKNSPPPKSFV